MDIAAMELQATLRNLCWASLFLVIGACTRAPCSGTSFGDNVVCIRAHGAGSSTVDETYRTVELAPAAGHAVIVAAYQCWDALCATTGTTTMRLSDNLNDPEPCFTKSPNSPFTLVETSTGAEHLQQYMWYCPSIPAGVSAFTVTCSVERSCSYITVWVSEWTGLTSDPTVAAFDTDGGAASKVRETIARVSTNAATRYTRDLVIACGDNTHDLTMTPRRPYAPVNQFYPGNVCMARMVSAAGEVQTATATWKGDDDWYFTIAAIRSARSVVQPSH